MKWLVTQVPREETSIHLTNISEQVYCEQSYKDLIILVLGHIRPYS